MVACTIVRAAGLFDTAEPTGDYKSRRDIYPPVHLVRRPRQTLLRETTGPGHARSVIEVVARAKPRGPATFPTQALRMGKYRCLRSLEARARHPQDRLGQLSPVGDADQCGRGDR